MERPHLGIDTSRRKDKKEKQALAVARGTVLNLISNFIDRSQCVPIVDLTKQTLLQTLLVVTINQVKGK